MFFTKFLSDFYELNLNSLKTSIAKNKPQEIQYIYIYIYIYNKCFDSS